MPIRPENRARYPKNWKAISLRIRERAGWRCEGSPAFPDCRAQNGQAHPVTGSIVVLTVAHLDHQPENCADDNLRAWCQRCHNTYDAPMRRAGIRKRAFVDQLQLELEPEGLPFDRVWFWRSTLPHRKGQPCRILARGTMNACRIEFEDGERHIVSRFAVRKAQR